MSYSALVALSGENFTSLDASEERELLKKEIEFWRSFIREHEEKSAAISHVAFSNIRDTIKLLEGNYEGYIYDDLPGVALKDSWVYSGSPATIRWLELHRQDPQVAEGFYDAIFLRRSENLGVFSCLSGYLLAYEFKYSQESSFSHRADVEIEALKSIHNDYLARRKKLSRQARQSIKLFSAWKGKERSEWQGRVQSLEATYREKLRLEGPAKYWGDKALQHSTQGVVWAVLLFLLLLSSTVGLWVSFNLWLTGDRTAFGLNNVSGVLLFVTLISTLAISIRALSKLAFSSFHLQRDAEEREQLTHLYLALSKETVVDDESRKIILQSLFSRSETGLISNESGPTMPGLSDLLSNLKKPG